MADWFVLAAVGISAVMAGFWVGRWSGQVSPVGELEGSFRENGELPEHMESPEAHGSFRADVSEGRGIARSMPLAEESGRARGGRGKDGRGKARGVRDSEDDREGRGKGIYREHGRKRHPGREKKIPLGWAIGSPVSGHVSTFYEGNRRGALLLPDQGRIFAPASGKIIRLYPMGNRMLLRTDSGVELLIQVGGDPDELCGMYFRPRVVQNEIVNKGKLLLEYDREKLAAEGADTGVSISVEEADNLRDITVTGVERVKAGEELLWVREYEYLT